MFITQNFFLLPSVALRVRVKLNSTQKKKFAGAHKACMGTWSADELGLASVLRWEQASDGFDRGIWTSIYTSNEKLESYHKQHVSAESGATKNSFQHNSERQKVRTNPLACPEAAARQSNWGVAEWRQLESSFAPGRRWRRLWKPAKTVNSHAISQPRLQMRPLNQTDYLMSIPPRIFPPICSRRAARKRLPLSRYRFLITHGTRRTRHESPPPSPLLDKRRTSQARSSLSRYDDPEKTVFGYTSDASTTTGASLNV